MQSYDIIGDIHGCNVTLEKLLVTLGYTFDIDGTYQHADRKVIFLGDFIDRGPGQREVIAMVKAMIDAGSALSVMGNHEYNAIAYATIDEVTATHLRPHSDKNRKQHIAFLDAYENDTAGYNAVIKWFRTLPLWLDLGDIRIIHACWDKAFIGKILAFQAGDLYLGDRLLHASCDKHSWQFDAIETLLKGKEIPLPEGKHFHDKDGNIRRNIRTRWWDRFAKTYKQAYFGPDHAQAHIPDDEICGEYTIDYSHDEPPLFLGHYWMEGRPSLLAPNIACTDYSVAKPGGKLVAYRWDGERHLDRNKFVAVNRIEA
jgi:hypothetical protein